MNNFERTKDELEKMSNKYFDLQKDLEREKDLKYLGVVYGVLCAFYANNRRNNWY